jgi:hypothetical protein
MKKVEQPGEMEEKPIKENIIREYSVQIGEEHSAGVFRVNRPFYLKTKNGPLVMVEKNELVELGKETAAVVFSSGKVDPVNIAEKFKVVRPFRTVTYEGKYLDVRVDDEISELSKDEALKLMRGNFIKPITEEV